MKQEEYKKRAVGDLFVLNPPTEPKNVPHPVQVRMVTDDPGGSIIAVFFGFEGAAPADWNADALDMAQEFVKAVPNVYAHEVKKVQAESDLAEDLSDGRDLMLC